MVPEADPSSTISLILGVIVLFAAGFLGWHQLRDSRQRPADLSPLDASYFNRQDLRRLLGIVVMIVLGLVMALGGGIPSKVEGRANIRYVQLWSGVLFLIVVLLCLASMDWVSNRLYARRRIHELAREGIALIKEEIRVRAAIASLDHDGNGVYTPDDLP